MLLAGWLAAPRGCRSTAAHCSVFMRDEQVITYIGRAAGGPVGLLRVLRVPGRCLGVLGRALEVGDAELFLSRPARPLARSFVIPSSSSCPLPAPAALATREHPQICPCDHTFASPSTLPPSTSPVPVPECRCCASLVCPPTPRQTANRLRPRSRNAPHACIRASAAAPDFCLRNFIFPLNLSSARPLLRYTPRDHFRQHG